MLGGSARTFCLLPGKTWRRWRPDLSGELTRSPTAADADRRIDLQTTCKLHIILRSRSAEKSKNRKKKRHVTATKRTPVPDHRHAPPTPLGPLELLRNRPPAGRDAGRHGVATVPQQEAQQPVPRRRWLRRRALERHLGRRSQRQQRRPRWRGEEERRGHAGSAGTDAPDAGVEPDQGQ